MAPDTAYDQLLLRARLVLAQIEPYATDDATRTTINQQKELVGDLERAQYAERLRILSQGLPGITAPATPTTGSDNLTNILRVRFNDKMKILDPPFYKGDRTLDIVETWLINIEAWFGAHESLTRKTIGDEQKITLLITYLQGEAKTQQINLTTRIKTGAALEISTYNKFVTAFFKMWGSINARDRRQIK